MFAVAQALLSGSPDPGGHAQSVLPDLRGRSITGWGHALYIPNPQEQDYRPDFAAVTADQWRAIEMVYICSPGNPTGQIMSAQEMAGLIELAHQHDFVIVSDECYSELYFDDDNVPTSLLSVAQDMGSRPFERCLSFHSLSKRSNLPGRSGVAGDQRLLARYLSYRTIMAAPCRPSSARQCLGLAG